MESDSVRSAGEFTVVDMWVEGKLRCVSVSRDAIDGFLRLSPERAAALTDEDRREFVRTHLGQVVAAAKTQLQSIDPTSDSIVIGAVQAPAGEASGDLLAMLRAWTAVMPARRRGRGPAWSARRPPA